jgi:hypothetical protein
MLCENETNKDKKGEGKYGRVIKENTVEALLESLRRWFHKAVQF